MGMETRASGEIAVMLARVLWVVLVKCPAICTGHVVVRQHIVVTVKLATVALTVRFGHVHMEGGGLAVQLALMVMVI